ncbi:MAG: phosphoribosylglycinamide formyltransferase [Bdellovibrionales bacterium]
MIQKIKIAVLISGSGSNLQALIDACASPDFPAEIVTVISNRPDAYGLERAQKASIPAHLVDHKDYSDRAAFDAALLETLNPYDVDLVCLAGFMRVLTPVFIDAFEGRILNTHPALLPRHGGKGMYGQHVHKAVLAAGDPVSGVSIHSVIAAVDQGPVILQREVGVEPDDTPETLAARVLAQEHIAYPQAVKMIAEKMLNS